MQAWKLMQTNPWNLKTYDPMETRKPKLNTKPVKWMKTSSFNVPTETPPNFFSSLLNVASASYTRTTFGLNVSTRFLANFCGKEFPKYFQAIQWSNANRSLSCCSTMEARSPYVGSKKPFNCGYLGESDQLRKWKLLHSHLTGSRPCHTSRNAYWTRRSCRNSFWQKTAACSSTKTKTQNAAVRILKKHA